MAKYTPKSVQEAWDNHFGAFGAKDMDKILLDYNEESVITLFNATTKNKDVFKGVQGAKNLFEEVIMRSCGKFVYITFVMFTEISSGVR